MNNQQLLTSLIDKQETIAFAESCTAGLACATFAHMSGVSNVLLESVITYSNAAKHARLGVPLAVLDTFGAVSEEVVTHMANGVVGYANADMGVAISGIAGPTGGSAEKPVGLVWFAVSYKGEVLTDSQVFKGDRQAVQSQAAVHALALAYKHFKSVNKA